MSLVRAYVNKCWKRVNLSFILSPIIWNERNSKYLNARRGFVFDLWRFLISKEILLPTFTFLDFTENRFI